LAAPELSVVAVLGLLWLALTASGRLGSFTSEFNRDALTRSISLQSIFAVGELLVILTGGIDLSLGSLVAFAGMLLATTMTRAAAAGWAPAHAMALGISVVILFSLGLGLLHGALIHRLRLPPFVVTLASMSVLRSLALLINNAVPIPIEGFPLISYLGNGKLFLAGTAVGLPVTALLLALLGGGTAAMLAWTPIGRQVYAVGSSEEAARLSGVNVLRIRLLVYGLSGLLGGIAGILYTGYGGQGDPSSGVMFELNAVSAVVIGGAVLTGGRGSVVGTILGAMLLEWILSIINLTIDNPTLYRGSVVGGVLLLSVILNQLRQLWLRGARG
jgi:ribose transport system permease protein